MGLSLDVDALYIRDYSLFSLFVINKQSLELENALTIPEGRGPGELSRIKSFAVSGNRIVLVDQSLFKIQIRNREGEPEGEFLEIGRASCRERGESSGVAGGVGRRGER